MDAPLAGLLVADLTQNIAGPYCTQILGDMGAQVVKVERPGRGDDARAWAPPYWGRESATFMSVNRNKRSLAVAMKAPEGRATRTAGRRADVSCSRCGRGRRRPGSAEDARRINPRLVYCSITAFGIVGPLVDRPGYDPLMQAYGGIMSVNGHRGQAPARVAMSIIDMGTGMWAVTAILAALRERDRTGRGAHVTTALFDTAIAAITVQMGSYLATGEVPEPQGSGTQMIAPYEAFPTRDAWVMVGAASDALFVRTCEALGLAELPADPRYASNPARVTHREELFETLAAVTRTLATDDLLARLLKAGVPSAPILKLDQVAALPQTEASGMLVSAKHPRLDDYRGIGLPIRWDGERPGVARVPPLLGEHTAEVLAELGFDDATIKDLGDRHVVQL
jgi:formyl-CoA transferase/CoA:oxalate CoA-transferase